jgi:hypothetical protein
MNKLNRLSLRLSGSRLLLGVLACFVVLVATARHPALGTLVLILIGVGWLLRSGQQTRRDWSPNVLGENAYQILGVAHDADVPTIRRAFRELERQYHPDAVAPERKAEATLLFVKINQAYELLSDTEKRFQYDAMIDEAEGRIPPFEEAYQRLKDEDKHPIYAAYDALYSPARDEEPGEWDDESRPADAAGPAPHRGTGTPSATGDVAGPPVEVDMPDAVREAMGLPPQAPSPPNEDRDGR